MLLQDWQASTELKIREQQRLEVAGSGLQVGEATQDTEDDTVSSMEYEEYSPGPGPEQRQRAGTAAPASDDLTFIKRNPNFQEPGPAEQPPEAAAARTRAPRPYLKRGSGLARFNLPTDLSSLPCRVRRSQPRVRGVQSKYTQDTQVQYTVQYSTVQYSACAGLRHEAG